MGFLSRAVSERKASDPLALWAEIARTGRVSKAGPTVNLENALKVATLFACMREIAQGGAQIPFKLFKQDGDQKRVAYDHPLYDLMTFQPNDWTNSFEFRETFLMHASLGNAYAFINRGLGRKILELIIINPGRVVKKQLPDYSIVYEVIGDSGAMQPFPAEAIWHLRGPSWDGVKGMEILSVAREALGLSLATEESHARLHSKGVRPSGLYSVDKTLNEGQYKALKGWIDKELAGSENAGAAMLLDNGAKFVSTAMTGLDAQHLETRKHQIEEVCRFMGVFPMIVFHSDKTSTFASAEAFFEANNKLTMSRWYARMESSANMNLLSKEDRKRGLYFKFMANGLLRGSAKDRAEYYARALGSGGHPGWMSPDEVREFEEMNPKGGEAANLPPGSSQKPQPTPA
jgi:HK97 family phage portal protein